MTVAEARATFRQLHRPGEPLVMPNAWDAGSARLFASLGVRGDRHDQLGVRRHARAAATVR